MIYNPSEQGMYPGWWCIITNQNTLFLFFSFSLSLSFYIYLNSSPVVTSARRCFFQRADRHKLHLCDSAPELRVQFLPKRCFSTSFLPAGKKNQPRLGIFLTISPFTGVFYVCERSCWGMGSPVTTYRESPQKTALKNTPNNLQRACRKDGFFFFFLKCLCSQFPHSFGSGKFSGPG